MPTSNFSLPICTEVVWRVLGPLAGGHLEDAVRRQGVSSLIDSTPRAPVPFDAEDDISQVWIGFPGLCCGGCNPDHIQCLVMERTKSNTSCYTRQWCFEQYAPHRMDGSLVFVLCPFLSDKDLCVFLRAVSDLAQTVG